MIGTSGADAEKMMGVVDLGNGAAAVLSFDPDALNTQGVRPAALLHSMRFGDIGESGESEHAREQLRQAVAGISDHGDAAGAPTVAGEIFFEPSYEQSPLIQTLTVGLAPLAELTDAPAAAGGDILAPGLASQLHPEQPTEPMYPKGPMVIPTGWSGGGTLVKMLGSANLASRQEVLGTDATVVALADAGIAVTIAGNGRRAGIDPRKAAAEAVYASAAQLACVGAEPLGLVHAFSVGDIENPNVAWQLSELAEGLKEACETLGVSALGGTVSTGNNSPGPILPTPVVAMVGRLPDAYSAGPVGFHTPGEKIALIGAFNPLRDGGEIAKLHGHPLAGMLPFKDLDAIKLAHQTVCEGIAAGRFTSARAVAEGGVAVALAKCCITGGSGAKIMLPPFSDVFGEDLGTAFLVTGAEADLAGTNVIGEIGGDELDIVNQLVVPVLGLQEAFARGLTESPAA